MDVSIIIVNYNTMQMTMDCINSIFEKTANIEFEIILIDNGSTDGSKELFESDDRIRYVYSYENMGFGRANNVGMMLAKGDYIFLLNSDTLLVNNAVKLLYDYAETHHQRAFYGCWLEDDIGTHINSGGLTQTITSILGELCKSYIPGRHEGDRAIKYSEEECFQIGFVTGADMFFHRKVYEETHGFDHQFFMYSEESDWQRSAFKKGINSYIINGPRIIHLEGKSQGVNKGEFNLSKFKRFTKSRYYYIKKEYSLLSYFGFRIMYFILYCPKILVRQSTGIGEKIRAIGVLVRGY
jgi:GT2 family glycosyltransferase